MSLRYDVKTHGYGGYTNGCRCATCRQAKADYTREARMRARWRSGTDGGGSFKHGRSGYDNAICRCGVCCAAKRAAGQAAYRRRKADIR